VVLLLIAIEFIWKKASTTIAEGLFGIFLLRFISALVIGLTIGSMSKRLKRPRSRPARCPG
jgi:hypothetical protein